MASENLLAEFPPVSTEQWEQVVNKDLKVADYAKRLLWKADDGVTLKPYYRREDLGGIDFLDADPGSFPYVRGNNVNGGWRIREDIEATNVAEANRLARQAVAAGAEEIAFNCGHIATGKDLADLVDGLGSAAIHLGQATPRLLELVAQNDFAQVSSADLDPLGDFEFAAKILTGLPASFRPFSISIATWEEAGATAAQQLGYGLAAGIEYLDAITARGVNIGRAASALSFSIEVSSSYFYEIAKLRGLRLLWSRVVESFGGSPGQSKAVIFARTARWNSTVYDPYVNVLRATTEAMSAALGGADSISVAPFDAAYAEPTDASRRLARNTQIILKAEAHLARVADPGGGSYYLEALTDLLAREAWKILQQVEVSGGFARFKAEGLLDVALEKSRLARETAVATRRRVLLGTNQYPDRKEKALERIDLDRVHSGGRVALEYEELRLRTEQHVKNGGHNPRVLLAEIGDAKMRAARAGFAANFFGCAGFDVITKRFESAEAIAATEADLLVLCSSDAEYPAIVELLTTTMKRAGRSTPVVVAGYPDSAEQLKASGVADFVHVRSNPIATLSRWQRYFEIGQS